VIEALSPAPSSTGPSAGADAGRLRQASEAFEALLMQILLRTMRQAQLERGFFGDGAGADTYEGIAETHLAEALAASSPLGLARQIEQRWSGDAGAAAEVRTALSRVERLRAEHAYAASGAIPARAEGASSGFGWRPDPLDGTRRFHEGVDLPAPDGTPVLSVAPGHVVSVGRNGGYGLEVLVDHGQGWVTRYAHLGQASVAPGQRVGRREVLGQVGRTGRTTGPHLHFEALRFGQAVDPRRAVPGALRIQVLPRMADESGVRSRR
jgi:murein DD-endopeptidase MepM/ murein hydrolase activator NlpD